MKMAELLSKLVSRLAILGLRGEQSSSPSAPPPPGPSPELTRQLSAAVRIRPPLKPTDPGFDLIPQRFQKSMVQVMSNTTLTIDAPQGRKVFVFDRVFAPEVDQAGMWEYLEDCVNAFTTGYNVSVLAYGQSGAGKSYTMGTSGPSEQEDLEVMGKLYVTSGRGAPRERSNYSALRPLLLP